VDLEGHEMVKVAFATASPAQDHDGEDVPGWERQALPTGAA
jgi:hypothetical protein